MLNSSRWLASYPSSSPFKDKCLPSKIKLILPSKQAAYVDLQYGCSWAQLRLLIHCKLTKNSKIVNRYGNRQFLHCVVEWTLHFCGGIYISEHSLWNISLKRCYNVKRGLFSVFIQVHRGFQASDSWRELRVSPLSSSSEPNWPALLDIIYPLCLTWQPWWQDKCPITHHSVLHGV